MIGLGGRLLDELVMGIFAVCLDIQVLAQTVSVQLV